VKQRQTAFKDIIKSFEPMGVMLRKGTYDAERFEKFTAELIAKRDLPWSHFGPDTNYPPTKATPRCGASRPSSNRRSRPSSPPPTSCRPLCSKDKAQVGAAYEAVHDSCKSCHKQFKAR
jgi:cytochrome c556